MSRWLNQVNSLLEKLDGQVESVAASSQPAASSLRSTLAQQAQAVASAVATVTTATRASDNDDDEEYYSEYDDDDDQEEVTTDDDDEYFTEEQSNDEAEFVEEDDPPEDVGELSEPPSELKAEPVQEKEIPPPMDPFVTDTASTSFDNESDPPDVLPIQSANPEEDKPATRAASLEKHSAPKPSQQSKESTSSVVEVDNAVPTNSHQQQLSLLQQQIERLKSQHTNEMAQLLQQNEAAMQQVMRQHDVQCQQLRQQNDRLTGELQSLQTELKAVNKELQEAAGIVERERAAMKLERNELLEEQEDEVLQMKTEYEDKIKELRNETTAMKEQYERQLLKTRQQHNELGDTMEEQLKHMTERELEAQEQIQQLQSENRQLQAEVQQWHQQNTALQQQYDVTIERLTAAEAAVAAAEERLDETNAQHRKQLQQRLAREAALEQTVAQLSQQTATATPHNSSFISDEEKLAHAKAVTEYKAQYSAAIEELETVKGELAFMTQRCTILEKEFQDIVQERERDVERTLQLQQDYDHRIQQLMTADKNRSATSDDARQFNERMQQLTTELRQANEQIQSLSDQCLRQQTALDTQKTELLAWKSRCQEATARAETAESERMNDVELGRPVEAQSSHRRRVKGAGGSSRYSTLPNRSMRMAMGLHRAIPRGRGNYARDLQEQLGTTVDAMDHWMVETGHILRHEPLARLGFAIYFVTIHLFCFALVAFHTIEAEHGDLGQLTNRHRGSAMYQPIDQGLH